MSQVPSPGAGPGAGGLLGQGRLELALSLLLAALVCAPLVLGRGVDMPDDLLYYDVAGWEWLRHAWRSDLSPWFVPGKLGGVSLFGDAVAMAPFYPGCWLLLLLPSHVALPLAWMLHAMATVVSVRWLARIMGASPAAGAVAGAAAAAGPLGVMGVLDGRAAGLAMYVWLPVALGALERLARSSQRGQRARWAVLAGLALALVFLGSHVRVAVAAAAVAGLWCLMRRAPLPWAAMAGLLGLAGGAPGYLPLLAEWGVSTSGLSRFAALQGPAHPGLSVWSLPGLLVPRSDVFEAHYGVGCVLTACALLALPSLDRPVRRLALLAGLLVLAVASPHVPGLRYLFAPLLLLTHPVNDAYLGLAVFPLAIVGATGLDWLATSSPEQIRARLGGWPGILLLLMLLGILVQVVLGWLLLEDPHQWLLLGLGLGLALVLLSGCGLVLFRRAKGTWRQRAICLAALAGLAGTALRFHLSAPSAPLKIDLRQQVPGADLLSGGYLDINDLPDLEGFAYEMPRGGEASSPEEPDEIERESWTQVALQVQKDLLARAWPVHLGLTLGIRGLSGRAKLPPSRQVALLMPLAEQLRRLGIGPDGVRELFGRKGALGLRVMALHGIAVAAYGTRASGPMLLGIREVVPRCYAPRRLEVVTDQKERVRRLLGEPLDPARPALALVERPEDALFTEPVPTRVFCPALPRRPDQASVLVQVEPQDQARGQTNRRSELQAGKVAPPSGRALVVLRERYHPGWRVLDEPSQDLTPFPVNQVHMGVWVGEGRHELTFYFRPPLLDLSLVLAAAALGLGLVLLLAGALKKRLGRALSGS